MSTHHFKQVAVVLLIFSFASVVQARGDDFNSVVKMIEQFYGVKHEGVPFLARAGMKAGRTAARIKGGTARQIAEAGSIKLAVFEDQDFNGEFLKFRSTLNAALSETWLPFVQVLGANEQNYIFTRENNDKYNVLCISIEEREATVIQVTLSPKNFARLLKDPEGTGKAIAEEATINDQE